MVVAEICPMRRIPTLAFVVFCQSSLFAGPEIFDPLEAWKKAGAPAKHPVTETVVSGKATEFARFRYENDLLVRIDYSVLGQGSATTREMPAGYTVFEYEKGLLAREKSFSAAETITEEIRYVYRKGRLEKSMIHDMESNTRIEWIYLYDKEGVLSGGKRLIAGKTTESFKLVKTSTGLLQNIYNARGELTAKVNSFIDNGLLTQRVKSGLTGTRYAVYQYNNDRTLAKITFHDTVRGEKILVKTHTFGYSLDKIIPGTAMNYTGGK